MDDEQELLPPPYEQHMEFDGDATTGGMPGAGSVLFGPMTNPQQSFSMVNVHSQNWNWGHDDADDTGSNLANGGDSPDLTDRMNDFDDEDGADASLFQHNVSRENSPAADPIIGQETMEFVTAAGDHPNDDPPAAEVRVSDLDEIKVD